MSQNFNIILNNTINASYYIYLSDVNGKYYAANRFDMIASNNIAVFEITGTFPVYIQIFTVISGTIYQFYQYLETQGKVGTYLISLTNTLNTNVQNPLILIPSAGIANNVYIINSNVNSEYTFISDCTTSCSFTKIGNGITSTNSFAPNFICVAMSNLENYILKGVLPQNIDTGDDSGSDSGSDSKNTTIIIVCVMLLLIIVVIVITIIIISVKKKSKHKPQQKTPINSDFLQ